MIPQIEERYFPEYATLHQATVSLTTMGERTISTQIRIDGDVVPEFGVTQDGVFHPMELRFKGERFVLPVREPQAMKDNTTRNSLIDLTFVSWPTHQMKRYFFVEMASVTAGTAIADKYIASLALSLENFVDAFNNVLNYYFNGKIQMDLFLKGQGIYSNEVSYVEINYSYIWDVLTKIYDIYDVRWWIEYNEADDVYYIKVGYTPEGITDHDFAYGYEGGLLKFERQLQDDNITNILLGRGGEKNLPYRYFKRTDEYNTEWAADPDAIPELANIYFDRLRDINFRSYVQGWRTNPHRDTSWELVQNYDAERGATDWAYAKGHNDEQFNPVEYVKDDESIEKFGEHWGALDDNDDIYPTIQGVALAGLGRVDEVVDVSEIVTDDIDAYAEGAAVETSIRDLTISLRNEASNTHTILSETFTIDPGETGNITYRPMSNDSIYPNFVFYNTERSTVEVISTATGGGAAVETVTNPDGAIAISGIPAGTYRLRLNLVLTIASPASTANGTFGIENIVLTTSATNTEAWKPTFDIWVKNIWETTQETGESDADYSTRVWQPILGDRVGNEAKIVFSTGPMSASQDYEFTIASYPVVDRSKQIVTKDSDGTTTISVPSEWKITVYKSDAEYDATGLYIPNAQSPQPTAGNNFFFTGIDMPHIYVVWAEERLNAYKENALDGMANTNPTWVITLDKVRVNTMEDSDYEQTLADRLATGIAIRTTDPRFTHGDVLTLYVQSITYTWNEPSQGSPYLVPDIEVVLSDKLIATQSAIGKLQNEVSVISQSYVGITDVEQVVRKIAGSLYLKKTGESDTSSSPTTFSSKVTSRDFRKGSVGGRGWGLYEDNYPTYASDVISQASGSTRRLMSRGLLGAGTEDASTPTKVINTKSVFEVDKLIVRDEMQVNTLVVNQIEYRGGKEIISAAKIEVSLVVDTGDSYVCYFDQKQNSVANLFRVNDIAYGQVWNADNSELRYYKMLVTATDINSITLSKSIKDGAGVPAIGDVIVQFGNTTDTARQYVILRDVIGGGYEQMLSGLNSVHATGNEYYFAGMDDDGVATQYYLYDEDGNPLYDSDGRRLGYTAYSEQARWFVGDKSREYAEWIDGELTIKGRFSVRGEDGNYYSMSSYLDSLEYLHEATNEGTLVQGGLLLTSMIQLGSTQIVEEQPVYTVYAGLNGIYNGSAQGGGIAAWFGGPMVDHEANPTAASYAESLFRFDGTGYLAGGNITWNADGSGEVAGGALSWDTNGIPTIAGGLVITGSDNTTLLSLLQKINAVDWFVPTTSGGRTTLKLNPKYAGMWAEGFVSAGGLSSTQGGGGGASVLNDLDDVALSTLNTGDILCYNGVAWTNQSLNLTGYVTTQDLATALSSYVTETDLRNASMTLWGQTASLGDVITGDLSSVGKISFDAQSAPSATGNVIEVVNIGTTEAPVYALHSTLPFYSDGFVSAGGLSAASGGGGASVLSDLDDVVYTSALSWGQVLTYDSVNNVWVNTTLSLPLDSLSDVSTSGAQSGQVLTFNGTTWEPKPVSGGSSGQTIFFGTCSTSSSAGSNVTYNVVCPEFTASDLQDGTVLVVAMGMTVSRLISSTMLNVNSTGATSIINGTRQIAWNAGETVIFVYSGVWHPIVSHGYLSWYVDTYASGGSGDSVSFSQVLTSGTEIGRITINDTTTSIYAPSGGSGEKTYTSGTGITVNNTSNTISLKTATASTIGGVKPMVVRTPSSASYITGGTTAGRYYGVEMNNSGQLFVNVPWIEGGGGTGSYLPLSGGTMTGTINSQNIIPKTTATYDLGSSSNYWNSLYLGYNSTDSAPVYLYYDATNGCIRVRNAGFAADGFVSAGGVQGASALGLNDLNDVDVSFTYAGQLLGYNADTAQWEPVVSAPPQNGYILVYNSDTQKWVPTDITTLIPTQ